MSLTMLLNDCRSYSCGNTEWGREFNSQNVRALKELKLVSDRGAGYEGANCPYSSEVYRSQPTVTSTQKHYLHSDRDNIRETEIRITVRIVSPT